MIPWPLSCSWRKWFPALLDRQTAVKDDHFKASGVFATWIIFNDTDSFWKPPQRLKRVRSNDTHVPRSRSCIIHFLFCESPAQGWDNRMMWQTLVAVFIKLPKDTCTCIRETCVSMCVHVNEHLATHTLEVCWTACAKACECTPLTQSDLCCIN